MRLFKLIQFNDDEMWFSVVVIYIQIYKQIYNT